LTTISVNPHNTRSCGVRSQISRLPLFRDDKQGKAYPKAQNGLERRFGGISGKIELSTGKSGLSVDKWRECGGVEPIWWSSEGDLLNIKSRKAKIHFATNDTNGYE